MNWRAIGAQSATLVEGLSRPKVRAGICRVLRERVLRSSATEQ
ncbi:MAG TPA: hypothetical protein VMD79_04695 [Solirubrobacteraceae bacterium]|nr:hypothetical protein [Solirubrobacteraceae bacterium]